MLFKQGILSLLLLAVVMLAGVQTASATSEMMEEFNQVYDTNGTRLDTCSVCHGEDVESLNPYGAYYRENDADLEAIETLDSDGDGFSNQEEISALTFPGDMEDMPEAVSEEPATDDEQQSPGFEAVLGLAGIVMAIYMIKRK